MSTDLRIENILIQVRSKLQEGNVKLWLPPYYIENVGPSDTDLERLATDFAIVLNIPIDYCLAAITELQNHALDKLRAKNEFSESGLATIKVRLPNQPGGTRLLTTQVKLTDIGKDLQEAVGKQLSVSQSRIKLISAGKVLRPEITLENQGIINNQQIMALIIQVTEQEAAEQYDVYDRVKKIKEDAALCLKGRNSLMHMEDQAGNTIHLPVEEEKSLLMALALHEKGKVVLNKENYSEALILLLEADNEYKNCRSQLLKTVDNYALLNLDIVWCYLCLKSVMQLPDVENRLMICEENFKKSYGENFDRVVALKGSSGNEKTLVMRLHLLQAILLFHQNRRNEAINLLLLAESELKSLKVNDIDLIALIEMGYTPAEGRLGLRACNGNVENAITYIMEQREIRSDARKRAREENKINKLLGNDNNGTQISPRNYHLLIEMGYKKELCAIALRKCNNNLSDAITMLQENKAELVKELNTIVPDEALIEQLKQLGFDRRIIEIVLKESLNDMNEAMDMLMKLQNDGQLDGLLDAATALIDNTEGAGAIASTSNAINTKKLENKIDEIKALERFSADLPTDEDGYLDSTLIQEETILEEYKKYLNM